MMVAMGVLNTMESILTIAEESEELLARIEPIVLQIIGYIISNQCMGKYHSLSCAVCQYDYIVMNDLMFCCRVL